MSQTNIERLNNSFRQIKSIIETTKFNLLEPVKDEEASEFENKLEALREIHQIVDKALKS